MGDTLIQFQWQRHISNRVKLAISLVLISSLGIGQPSVLAHELNDWDLQIEKAEKLRKQGKKKEALALLISSYKQLNGLSHGREHHPKKLEKALSLLSSSYRQAGDRDNEYITLIILAAFYRYLKAADSVDYADCLWQLGMNCEHRGSYEEGLASLKQASEIYKRNPNIGARQLSKIERGLGHLYSKVGLYAEADKSLSSAIKNSNKLLDQRTHDLGRALLLKGKMYQKQKKYITAFDAYRQSVEVFKANLKKGHLWISQALDAYAGLVSILLENHKNTDNEHFNDVRKEAMLRTLADAQLLNNRYYKAKETLLLLKKFYEKHKFTDRLAYANCLEDLGECCLLMGDLKEGHGFQKTAVAVYANNLLDKDSEARALVNLALLERTNGDVDKAFATLSKAKVLTRQIHGEHSLAFGDCLQVEFKWLLKDGKIKELQPILLALSKVYNNNSIPKTLMDREKLKKVMLSLELSKRDRFHDHLWNDFERTDKSKIF